MISNSSKIADQKITVSMGRKSVCTTWIKDIEKYASTIPKHDFHFKKYLVKSKKVGVHQQEYGPSLKFDFPQISVKISIRRKKLGIKKILFPVDKNSFSIAGMKDWLQIMFQLKKKLLLLVAVDLCLRKWKKMISTSQKISFHQFKYALSFKTDFPQFS